MINCTGNTKEMLTRPHRGEESGHPHRRRGEGSGPKAKAASSLALLPLSRLPCSGRMQVPCWAVHTTCSFKEQDTDIYNPEGRIKPCPVSTALLTEGMCQLPKVHLLSLCLFEQRLHTVATFPLPDPCLQHEARYAALGEPVERSRIELLSGFLNLTFIY